MKTLKHTVYTLLFTLLFACIGAKKIKEPTKPYIEISTNYGKMIVDLYDKTPLHKANFMKLAKTKYLDSTLFHRVIRGFMIQGGDPDSKTAPANKALGNGGPGYLIPAEFDTAFIHKKGVIAAARTNNPEKKSSGSQFYIVQGKKYSLTQINSIEKRIQSQNPNFKYSNAQKQLYVTLGGTPHLDGGYTVFGEVISGLSVLDAISIVPQNRTLGNRPNKDVRMFVKIIQLTAKQVDSFKMTK